MLATFGLVAIATAAAAAAAATAAANTNREAYAHPIPGAFIIVAKYPVLVVSTAKLVATAAATTETTLELSRARCTDALRHSRHNRQSATPAAEPTPTSGTSRTGPALLWGPAVRRPLLALARLFGEL